MDWVMILFDNSSGMYIREVGLTEKLSDYK